VNGQAVSPLPRAGILFRVLWVIAPLAIVVVVLSRLAEFSAIAGALAGASPIWLGAAVICTALYTVNQSLVYHGVFRLMGAAVPFGDALGLTLVMAFASLALPAGTATGVTYFVSEARRRRVAAPLALLTALGYYLFDYGAFVPILLAALVVLHGASDAGVLSLMPLTVFGGLIAAVAGAAVWGLLHPDRVAAVIARAAGEVARLTPARREWLAGAAVTLGREIQEICAAVRRAPVRASRPFLHAFLLHAAGIGVLGAIFVALGWTVPLSVLISAYAAGGVFMVVSITPSATGVVEPVMMLVLTSFGVPLEVAAAAAVLFRVFTFWLPLFAGFLAWRLAR